MGTTKVDSLAVGRGSLTDNSNAAIVFTANNPVDVWLAISTYAQYNVIEYSGKMYRSKIATNLNNQPDISPNQWEVLYVGPKDGDVCFVINANLSQILQRKGGYWQSVSEALQTISLNDGQGSYTDAILWLTTDFPYGEINYTIKRGSGEGRKRHGKMVILNDTISDVSYSHEFEEIGADIGVTLNPIVSAGYLRLQYTSTSDGNALQMKYTLKGW